MARYEIVQRSERPAEQNETHTQSEDRPPELTPQQRAEKAAFHRQKVTRWLCEGFEAGTARCCVVGPGCGGHLDLPLAISHFAELHLIDVSTDHLNQVLSEQSISPDSLQSYIVEDIAGIGPSLQRMKELVDNQELKFHDVQEGIEAAHNMAAWPVPEGMDIVLSTETLGMVLSACAATTGAEHPSLPDFMHAIRMRHLMEMLRLLRPQGYGLIINQLVNSRVMPSLPKVPPDHFENLLSELIQTKRIPVGSSPVKLRDMLEHDQEIKHQVSAVHLLRPWVFDTGSCQFAMAGISFQKGAPAVSDEADETAG